MPLSEEYLFNIILTVLRTAFLLFLSSLRGPFVAFLPPLELRFAANGLISVEDVKFGLFVAHLVVLWLMFIPSPDSGWTAVAAAVLGMIHLALLCVFGGAELTLRLSNTLLVTPGCREASCEVEYKSLIFVPHVWGHYRWAVCLSASLAALSIATLALFPERLRALSPAPDSPRKVKID
jgi:hypothetical protein